MTSVITQTTMKIDSLVKELAAKHGLKARVTHHTNGIDNHQLNILADGNNQTLFSASFAITEKANNNGFDVQSQSRLTCGNLNPSTPDADFEALTRTTVFLREFNSMEIQFQLNEFCKTIIKAKQAEIQDFLDNLSLTHKQLSIQDAKALVKRMQTSLAELCTQDIAPHFPANISFHAYKPTLAGELTKSHIRGFKSTVESFTFNQGRKSPSELINALTGLWVRNNVTFEETAAKYLAA